MRVLLVPHIGETLGHFVRALSIADALQLAGADVSIATSSRWGDLYPDSAVRHRIHALDWNHSHNSMPSVGAAQMAATAKNLREVIEDLEPDVVVGDPGVFSVQVSRGLGLRHLSLLHTSWLAPLTTFAGATSVEESALKFACDFFDTWVDPLMDDLSSALAVPALTYSEYLATETILAVQPAATLPQAKNLAPVGFVQASLGEPIDIPDDELATSCYICFGQGTRADLSALVNAAADVFPLVIVSLAGGRVENVSSNVKVRQNVATDSVAGHVRAAITHGGIGGVGTLAAHATPQLIIPTDVSQALMAIHASRLGIASVVGLDDWALDAKLGRRLPKLDPEGLHTALEDLATAGRSSAHIPGDGAQGVAKFILDGNAGS